MLKLQCGAFPSPLAICPVFSCFSAWPYIFFSSSLIILQECGSRWTGLLELCLPFSDFQRSETTEPRPRRGTLLWAKPRTSASAAARPHSHLQALDPSQNLHTALGVSDLFVRHHVCWDCSSLFRSEIQSSWV